MNGDPIAHRSSDVQTLDKNEKIELYVLIPGETEDEDSEQEESWYTESQDSEKNRPGNSDW